MPEKYHRVRSRTDPETVHCVTVFDEGEDAACSCKGYQFNHGCDHARYIISKHYENKEARE